MTNKLILLTFFFLLILTNCRNSKPEIIEVKHFYGVIGLHLKYEIWNNKLIVKTDSDFESFSEEVIYKRTLSKQETKQLVSKIKALKPDTLEKEYINLHVLDGLYTEINLGKLIDQKQKTIIIDNVDLEIVDSISCYIDDLILEKKYRFNSFGQD